MNSYVKEWDFGSNQTVQTIENEFKVDYPSVDVYSEHYAEWATERLVETRQHAQQLLSANADLFLDLGRALQMDLE